MDEEYIPLSAALSVAAAWCPDDDGSVGKTGDLREMLDELEAIEPADVRPVVLCRECYAYQKDAELAEAASLNPDEYCALLRTEMPEHGFCYYGKIASPNCGADMRPEPPEREVLTGEQ